MFNFRIQKNRRNKKNYEITPDEIFLDSSNLSGFNEQQLEGVIERPLHKRIFSWLMIFFIACMVIFVAQLIRLQVVGGEKYFAESERNRIHRTPIFSERGIIYDRAGIPLAWNSSPVEGEPFSRRAYIARSGFGHVLGYVSYPQKDTQGFYWQKNLEGKAGAELLYNPMLQGEHGAQLIETDATLKSLSYKGIVEPVNGENISLTLDANMQAYLHEGITQMITHFGYEAGAGIIMDVHTGEIIALTNAPEYDPYILAEGNDQEKVKDYLTNPKGYFLNRAVSGLYSPGSIIKPFIALGALQEGVITEETTIMSTGRIEIPNPYNPSTPSIFRDWKSGGHGATNVQHALAESVNTFFYAIGGGYKDQKGIGIEKINQYVKLFAIASPTGIIFGNEPSGTIPSPRWKKQIFNDAWRLGDTYITSIGQFGFQVTPLQMVRAIGAIANGGKLVTPHIILDEDPEIKTISTISPEYYRIVRDGMREIVTKGTGQILNIPTEQIAAKTGTAQVGSTRTLVNSWSIGFYPYEDPHYAFVVVMERGPAQGTVNASWALRYMFDRVGEEDK